MFWFCASQKWLVSRKINLRKRLNLIDVGAESRPRVQDSMTFLQLNPRLKSYKEEEEEDVAGLVPSGVRVHERARFQFPVLGPEPRHLSESNREKSTVL